MGRWGATGTRGTYVCSKWHAYRVVAVAIRESSLPPFVIKKHARCTGGRTYRYIDLENTRSKRHKTSFALVGAAAGARANAVKGCASVNWCTLTHTRTPLTAALIGRLTEHEATLSNTGGGRVLPHIGGTYTLHDNELNIPFIGKNKVCLGSVGSCFRPQHVLRNESRSIIGRCVCSLQSYIRVVGKQHRAHDRHLKQTTSTNKCGCTRRASFSIKNNVLSTGRGCSRHPPR